MWQEIIASVLPFATLVSFTLSTPATPSGQVSETHETVRGEKAVEKKPAPKKWVVEKGQTLSVIARKEYGQADYWKNIWNKNPWIENPNLVEEGWEITLLAQNPTEVAELKPELEEKLRKTSVRNLAKTPSIPKEASQTPEVITASLSVSGPLTAEQITFLGNCESGMNASANTGNGYYGAFQFSQGTWSRMQTGYERADLAPLEVQIAAVQKLLSGSSIFGQFPACARRMQANGHI